MKATNKRFAFGQAEPVPETNDNAFRSKRIMVASTFDAHRAGQSRGTEAGLDAHRAGLSRQHVRALNTQFASWVQLQLQNHPDELWEDGARDYLSHASNIMEKFSDVVAWLKANAGKTESMSPVDSHGAEKNLVPEAKVNEVKFQLNDKNEFGQMSSTASFGAERKLVPEAKVNEVKFQPNDKNIFGQVSSSASFGGERKLVPEAKVNEVKFQPNDKNIFGQVSSSASFGGEKKLVPEAKVNEVKFQLNDKSIFGQRNDQSIFGQVSSTASLASPWSPSLLSNNQSPALFGTQSATTVNREASNDPDGEEEEQPSSPSVKKTEEKGIIVVHEVKCKLYVKPTDPADKEAWKDKGMGQLSIKCKEGVSKATKESKPTIIVRNDVGKVLLNALLYPGIKTNLLKNAIAAIFHTSGDADGTAGGDSGSVVARTYLLRTKTEEERNKLASAIQEYAPTA